MRVKYRGRAPTFGEANMHGSHPNTPYVRLVPTALPPAPGMVAPAHWTVAATWADVAGREGGSI
jgi:hypothetical protein